MSGCCLTASEQLVLAISWREQITFRRDDDDDARFVLDQNACWIFIVIAPLRYIILIPSQQVYSHATKCCVLSGKAAHTNFIVLMYPTGAPNHYPSYYWRAR